MPNFILKKELNICMIRRNDMGVFLGLCCWVLKHHIFAGKLPVNRSKSIQLVLCVVTFLGVQEDLSEKKMH